MADILIKNIGPVNSVKFNLNKLSVIIGPQSSGKSTIAKVLTFCQWLEKYAIIHQGIEDIKFDFVKETFLDYFKLNPYLRDGFEIDYHGDAINFSFKADEEISASKTDKFDGMAVGKIAYIPAERNLVSFPNLPSMKMEYDYVREYVFDWLSIHNKYTKENALKLPNLNLKFYFDSNKGDLIELEGGDPILLTEASSGVISMVPLYVYVHYLTEWVYEHKDDISFANRKNISQSVLNEFRKMASENNVKDMVSVDDSRIADYLFDVLPRMAKMPLMAEGASPLKKLIDLHERLSAPHYSRIIIEEPEINLDPNTQFSLINDLLSIINLDRDRVILTTHSPYILNHLNLLFKAYDKATDINGARLNYDDVNVYATENGSIKDIKVKNAHLINPEYLSAPLEAIYFQYDNIDRS